jgi:hypothetical protein
MASDQTPVPVVEQNKVQSEVALSLLGIPRAEVALGIFADVNTYDVNPSEWSMKPEFHIPGDGIQHLPTEAGALVEASRNKTAVLTSKRFFRYQPGRVSAATFGVKSSVSVADFSQNPSIRKFGIYDKYDGYYWETRNSGKGDNFSVIRRTQSLGNAPLSPYGIGGDSNPTPLRGDGTPGNITTTQIDDYRIIGLGASESAVVDTGLMPSDRKALTDARFDIVKAVLDHVAGTDADGTNGTYAAGVNGAIPGTSPALTPATRGYYSDFVAAYNQATGETYTVADIKEKCRRDLDYWIDNYLLDLKHGGDAHTKINTTNFAISNGADFDYDSGNFRVGVFPSEPDHFEYPIHDYFKTYINANASTIGISGDGTTAGQPLTVLKSLVDITRTAFNGSSFTPVDIRTGVDYGTRDRLETFFAVKKQFWSYYVTTKSALVDIDTQSASDIITYSSTGVGPSSAFSTKELKYKCQRDVGYIIDGYINDIKAKGNGETLYNASMFLRGTGLSVYSQQDSGQSITEPARHTILRTVIQKEMQALGFGSGTSERSAFDTLAGIVIGNFDEETTAAMDIGSENTKGFAGNLLAVRDGLTHVHAGVYDPSLLKDSKKVVAQSEAGATSADDTIRITEGVVTFGQHIKISWTGDANNGTGVNLSNRPNGGVYKVTSVKGPKGNEFIAVSTDDTPTQFDKAGYDTIVADNGKLYVDTVVPFIFPKDYDVTNADTLTIVSEIDTTVETLTKPAGLLSIGDHRVPNTKALSDIGKIPKGAMFPYMYAKSDDLLSETLANDYMGFVNTALDPNGPNGTGDNVDVIRSQIDNVNFFPEYVNWIKNNVKPEYYGVYEYRVPRSRFSHDSLDGILEDDEQNSRNRVYSDLATGIAGTVRPGENYTVTADKDEKQGSVYNFDFTKVTMLKAEFSWYGAVGALFLAYVPVGNGEARWVRVHHLRASNQLKVASLGNATLPITYTTYGGGSEYCLGDGEDANDANYGYGNESHHIVKYGASYYIDGGDRGTVRLYSHNNDNAVTISGKQYAQVQGDYSVSDTEIRGIGMPSIALNQDGTGGAGTASEPDIDPRFFMGASVRTSTKLDQNIKVVWADATKVYLNKPLESTSNITLSPDRADNIFGIETKKEILSTRESNAVRNRVQVYPTKLSSSNIPGAGSSGNNLRLRFKKTPLFQTHATTSGNLILSENYDVTSANLPLPIHANATYLANNESVYGWWRARIVADDLTVFGRVYKEADQYYFELMESYEGTVILLSGTDGVADEGFLPDLKFASDGEATTSTTTKSSTEKEGLSSVLLTSNSVVPIPGTGVNVATIYLRAGTEQFDLSSYFDYNKEYLSFPLTDIADSLYFAVDSEELFTGDSELVSLGVTWEEQ